VERIVQGADEAVDQAMHQQTLKEMVLAGVEGESSKSGKRE